MTIFTEAGVEGREAVSVNSTVEWSETDLGSGVASGLRRYVSSIESFASVWRYGAINASSVGLTVSTSVEASSTTGRAESVGSTSGLADVGSSVANGLVFNLTTIKVNGTLGTDYVGTAVLALTRLHAVGTTGGGVTFGVGRTVFADSARANWLVAEDTSVV